MTWIKTLILNSDKFIRTELFMATFSQNYCDVQLLITLCKF